VTRYRAYAAVLSGYTVALIAVQLIDSPLQVFDAGMQRGAAIAVGVLSVTVVNDLLFAPDRLPQLANQLAAIHRRIRDYAKAVVRGEAPDPRATADLIREIVALRPDITTLATESSSGPLGSAAARSTTVALVAELHAVRALAALPLALVRAFREQLTSVLDRTGEHSSSISSVEQLSDADKDVPDVVAALAWGLGELLQREEEVRLNLFALKSGRRATRSWRAPIYRSQRLAIESGVRAAAWFAMASAFFVLAGWPAASVSLSLLALIIGFGATTPSPRAFTAIAAVAMPIAIILAGTLEFCILDGVSDFPLLALGLAPFEIGAALLITLPIPALSALGRINLIVILVVFRPSNPQTYDPQAFLFTSLFACLAAGLSLAAQLLIPPVSDDRRRRSLVASARRELHLVLSRSDRRYAPEDAMFRDAVRVGQIAAAARTGPQDRASVEEALSYFDQAAAIRICGVKLAQLGHGPLANLAAEARTAVLSRDPQLIRAAAHSLRQAAGAEDSLATATSAALVLASAVIDAAPLHAANASTEKGS
jgi:Fusaric acid resistance protein family